MGRDYAGRQGQKGRKPPQQRRKQTQQPPPGLPGWLWMLIGITTGLVIAVGIYVVREGGQSGSDRTEPTSATRPAAEAQPAPRAQLPPKEEARFTFYEMLPSARLVPRSDDYTPPEPAAAREDIRYAIQAGSFGERSDADARRAEVALLGMESRIEPVKLDDGRQVYRVIIGPDTNFGRVKNRMAQLYEAGIESFFRRVDS